LVFDQASLVLQVVLQHNVDPTLRNVDGRDVGRSRRGW